MIDITRTYSVTTTHILADGLGQSLDPERMTGADWLICRGTTIDATDVGGVAGGRYLVELSTEDGTVIDSYETTTSGDPDEA